MGVMEAEVISRETRDFFFLFQEIQEIFFFHQTIVHRNYCSYNFIMIVLHWIIALNIVLYYKT